MKRWMGGLMACMTALVLAACGGSDDSGASPQAQCNSIGTQPKIVNGTACGQPEQSSVILLEITSGGSVARCSGTLITPTKVLTAAHCMPAGGGDVLVGAWSADGTVVGVPASGWAVHPQFQRSTSVLANDVAVVFLPSALPNSTMGILVSDPSATGQSVFIAGWGEPNFELVVGSATLGLVNEVSVGYTYTGKLANTCSGDSGGPAFRSVGGRSGVVGITSSGTAAGCGKGDQSLFTNVQGGAVINFIRSQAPDAAYL